MPERPRRKMPSLYEIAAFWQGNPRFPDYLGNMIGLGEPFCCRCGFLAPVRDEGPVEDRWKEANYYIERGHLIDRFLDGLDGPQNLVPLCWRCHRTQPIFEPGQEEEALAWVTRHHDTMTSAERTVVWRLGCIDNEGASKAVLDELATALLVMMAKSFADEYEGEVPVDA